MKNIITFTALLLTTTTAYAADLKAAAPDAAAATAPPIAGTPLWDIAFGSKLTSDFVARGYSYSNGGPAVQAYAELQGLDWVYANIFASSVRLPASYGLSDPSAFIGFSSGLRHTWGALNLDVGASYYYLPGQIAENALSPGLPANNADFYEVYARPTFTLNENIMARTDVYATTNYGGAGGTGLYLNENIRVDLSKWSPIADVGMYASGDFGYQWLGRTHYSNSEAVNISLPSYASWTLGMGFTYKMATFDLRYSGSQLTSTPVYWEGVGNYSGGTCGILVGIPSACGNRFMVTLSFDTTASAWK